LLTSASLGGRRAALCACAAIPVLASLALTRRVRGALVGAGALTDGRVEPASNGGFPRTLVGPTGQPHPIPGPPQRIVSTYLASDEILAELVGPSRVVGVSYFADDRTLSSVANVYPAWVPRLRTNVETVLALEPDLVCVAGFSDPDALRLIVGAGVPVLRWSRFDTFADVLANVRAIGAATGADARAAKVCAAADAELGEVEVRVAGHPPVRTLYCDPAGFTAGRGTLLDEILSRAGAANVAASAGVVGAGRIAIEAAMAAEPDAVVVPGYGPPGSAAARIAAAAGWRELGAVRARRIVEVPAGLIADVSPRAAQAVVALARALHPAAFAH
jgi:cobalamin transport system substrate-binding protein